MHTTTEGLNSAECSRLTLLYRVSRERHRQRKILVRKVVKKLERRWGVDIRENKVGIGVESMRCLCFAVVPCPLAARR
jgi:hypothetical protein